MPAWRTGSRHSVTGMPLTSCGSRTDLWTVSRRVAWLSLAKTEALRASDNVVAKGGGEAGGGARIYVYMYICMYMCLQPPG